MKRNPMTPPRIPMMWSGAFQLFCLSVILCWVLTACSGGQSGSGSAPLPQLPQQPFPEGFWQGKIGAPFGGSVEAAALADGSAWMVVLPGTRTSEQGFIVVRPDSSVGAQDDPYGVFLDLFGSYIAPIAFGDFSMEGDALNGTTRIVSLDGEVRERALLMNPIPGVDQMPLAETVAGRYTGTVYVGWPDMPVPPGPIYGGSAMHIQDDGRIVGMTHLLGQRRCWLEGLITPATQGNVYDIRMAVYDHTACPIVGVEVEGMAFFGADGEHLNVVMLDEASGTMMGIRPATYPDGVYWPPPGFEGVPD